MWSVGGQSAVQGLQGVADCRCWLVEGTLDKVEHGLKQLGGGSMSAAAGCGELQLV